MVGKTTALSKSLLLPWLIVSSAASLQNSEQSLFTGSTRNKLLLTSVEGWDYNLMWIKWPWMGSKPFMLLHPSPSSPAPFSQLTDKTNISGPSKI